jgi:hypothetical protein
MLLRRAINICFRQAFAAPVTESISVSIRRCPPGGFRYAIELGLRARTFRRRRSSDRRSIRRDPLHHLRTTSSTGVLKTRVISLNPA